MDNKYTFPVTQLLTYGDCSEMGQSFNEWPNYLELGFTQAHIPELISMATDEEWVYLDDLEAWAPIHAWRVLGQLQAIEAIKPLLHFESFLEYGNWFNDWVAEELPYVYGMMGENAIPVLTEYLFDDSNNLNPHMTVSSGLLRMGQIYPKTRTECVSMLTKKLECFTANDSDLNAFLISALVDLKAVESLPTIKKAYIKRSIDHAVVGDYENVEILMGVRKEGTPDEIKKIVAELEQQTNILPQQALTQAIQLREQMTPKLLEILRDAELEGWEFDENKDEYEYECEYEYEYEHEKRYKEAQRLYSSMCVYALYLLAQFREKSAYPLITKLFSLPGKISLDITGDVVTGDLYRILASVYDGDDTPLKNLIENPNIDEYVRSAALKTLVLLVVCGQKSREEVMGYFQSLFQGQLERQFSFAWNKLVICCVELYPEEVYEDIRQAYADDLVEGFFIRFEDVEETYALGKETALNRLQNNSGYTLIDDVIEEIRNWHCFKPSAWERTKPVPPSKPRKGPKIGRNDPCPCGSGKKYKKCCLNK